MKTVNLVNRRFVGKQIKQVTDLFITVESLDQMIMETPLLEVIDQQIVVYVEAGVVMVGREVIGNDPNFFREEGLIKKDFAACVAERAEYQDLELGQLFEEQGFSRFLIDLSGRVIKDSFYVATDTYR